MSETSQNSANAGAPELCRILEEIFFNRLDNAERLVRELLAKEPANKDAYRVLGQILHKKGNQKGAIEAYSTALSISGEDPSIVLDLGLILYRRGELKKAVDLYEKILSYDASNPELLYLLGLAQFHAGQTLKAITNFQKVIEVDPENRIAAYHLAIAFWRAGRLNECAEHLEKIIGAGTEDAAAHYYLGLSYYYLGQISDAAKHFCKSVELDPDDMRSRMFFKLIGERYESKESGRKRGRLGRAALLFRSSLTARITAAVIASFVLILALFGAYVIYRDGEAYIESVRQEAAAVSEAIERSISDIMNRNKKERIQDVFNEIGRDASFRQVRLLNKKGKVIASTDKSEKGLVFSRESENCKGCHAAGGKEKALFSERIFESEGTRSFERITLLYNREPCRKCHGSEDKLLGMLAVAGSLGEGDSRLSTRRVEFILFGLLSAVVLSIILIFMMREMMRKPISRLSEAVRKVTAGELDAEVPASGNDEISMLINSFNLMTREIRRVRFEQDIIRRELEQRVKASTAELEKANQELTSANMQLQEFDRRKSAFVQKVVHELRSPLNGMMSLVSILNRGLAGKMSEQQEDFLKRVEERGKGVVAMINELLNLEKLRSGLYPPRKTRLHFGSIVGKALEVVQGKADEKKIRISAEGLDSLPEIYADPEEMEEIVVNLASNSVKYTPYGGEIIIKGEVERGLLVFSVRDTGIGIPDKEMPLLFTEFFRASNAKMMEKEGTGLGLMIVKQIVERYGGEIKIESVEGKGTTVKIILPIL